jgi:hypothetical protein
MSCFLQIDDTSIFHSHKNTNQLITLLNNKLNFIDNWIKAVNIKKTNYMLFRPREKHISCNLSLSYDKQLLEQKKVAKFLGVYIDENLS